MFCSQLLWCWGSRPKHASNPEQRSLTHLVFAGGHETWPFCRSGDVITIDLGPGSTDGAVECTVRKNGTVIAKYADLKALGLQSGAKMMAYVNIDSLGEAVSLKYEKLEHNTPPATKGPIVMTNALKGALARLTVTCKRRGMKVSTRMACFPCLWCSTAQQVLVRV